MNRVRPQAPPNRLGVFTATPACLIQFDRRILNQCRVIGSRGWHVTVVLPGDKAMDGTQLWPGCELKTFSMAACHDFSYLYDLLGIPAADGPSDREIRRLRGLIDRLPAPRTAAMFADREHPDSARDVPTDEDILELFRITHGCLSAVDGLPLDAVLAADSHGALAARLLNKDHGIPYLFDSHEFPMGQRRKSLTYMKLIKRAEAESIHHAFCFYTTSDFMADLFRYEHGLPRRPLYVYNAPNFADTPLVDSLIAQTFGLPSSARMLLFHGGLWRYVRNIERLLRVAPELGTHNIHLVFLGYGALEPTIKAAGDNVHFHPAVDQDSMASWIHSATACLVPYVAVGINQRFSASNRIFDAIEMGTPVIVNESLEYHAHMTSAYGLGQVGPMETDDEMVSTLQTAVDRFEREPIADATWRKARDRFGFAVQRRKIVDMVEALEQYLERRRRNRLNWFDMHAKWEPNEQALPPHSLVAKNLLAHAKRLLRAHKIADARRALQLALSIEPDLPGLAALVDETRINSPTDRVA